MLAAARYGDASLPALVLLHGFLGTKADWLPLISELSQHFDCLCLDLPGHGDNQPEVSAAEMEAGFSFCVQDIMTRLDALGMGRFHLYGYSLGGRIALHLAKAYPERVLSLQLESCHPGLTDPQERSARAQNDKLWAERLATLSSREFLHLWYQQAVFADMTNDARSALIERRAAQLDRHPKGTLKQIYLATSLARQAPLWELPAALECECHFFAGCQDTKFTAIAQNWQKQQPIILHRIEQAGHNIHQANPKALIAHLISQVT